MINKNQQLAVEILGNTFTMLEYSGAQSIFYINQLLQALPWVSRLPILRASYNSYAQSVRNLHTQPSWYKPYYKLASGDSTRLFRRRDIDPLIAVAIVWARQTSPNLSRFTIAANMTFVLTTFAEGCREHGVAMVIPTEQEVTVAA
jgi:hypothetical protein